MTCSSLKERSFLDLMDEIEENHRNSLSEEEKIKYQKQAEKELEEALKPDGKNK